MNFEDLSPDIQRRVEQVTNRFNQNELVKRATVKLVCDQTGAPATGFLIAENERVFLYTCWHVVTKLDYLDIKVSASTWPPERRSLTIQFQDLYDVDGGVMLRSQYASETIPLYDYQLRPLWEQEQRETEQLDLNAVGIHVPRFYDVVRIDVTQQLATREQRHIVMPSTIVSDRSLLEGGALLIFGYPHGFSAAGDNAVMPVCIKRSIASSAVPPILRGVDYLLDGQGFPGMSGSPVFIGEDQALHLVGIYTGAIYSNLAQKNDGLGIVTRFRNPFDSVRYTSGFVPTA
jgi:hypothetical protein